METVGHLVGLFDLAKIRTYLLSPVSLELHLVPKIKKSDNIQAQIFVNRHFTFITYLF